MLSSGECRQSRVLSGGWGGIAAQPTCGRSPHLLPRPNKSRLWPAPAASLGPGKGEREIIRVKKRDGPPRLKREETQSVGRRRGVLINKTGEKVIQIEVRKGWWDGGLGSAWLPQQLCGAGLGLGSSVGTAAGMHHPAGGKVVAKPFPGSLGSLFPCKAMGELTQQWWF